jgi:hypothetical protein
MSDLYPNEPPSQASDGVTTDTPPFPEGPVLAPLEDAGAGHVPSPEYIEANFYPPGINDDAAWFAENNATFWRVLYRLRKWCADHGPVNLADGRRVGHFADGTDWDVDAVAEIAPALVSRIALTYDGLPEEIERILSLTTEEVPQVVWTIERTIDKPALNGMIRAGGETAERLKACKTAKARLKVVQP